MITLEHVSISFGATPVVHDVSFRVPPGGWLTLIGPNGAGKTSVLRAVGGLVSHDGSISVGGARARDLAPREIARRVALVPQEPEVPPGMTVSEYVLLGRTPHLSYLAREGARDRRVAGDVIDRLQLGALASRELGTLSGGERRRAVIGRALAQQAPILLLDEPTTALDVGRQQEVLDLVDELRRQDGLTVLAAMHDLTQAGQYADELVLLVDGQVVVCGRADEVLTRSAIERHYDARVRVLPVLKAGRAVVPVREASAYPADSEEEEVR
ncbi:MAG: ABC transporter ATP-binding protein [Actinomycetota bacterium]